MRILDRYILREIALNFLAVTSVLAVIMVSVRIVKVLNLASDNQLPATIVFSLIGFTSITQMTDLMPIGLFLGTMLGLGRLYHESEMAAVQSCGVGARQILRPVLLLCGITCTFLAWLSFILVPDVYGHAQQIRTAALQQARLANIVPQHFDSFAGGDVVYYAEKVDANGVLYNVFVQRRSGEKVEVTVADRAEQLGAGELQQTFVLYKGQSYEGVPGSGAFRITRFEELRYPITLPSPEDWGSRIEGRPTIELIGSADGHARAEFQRRMASPFMALILAILAIPLARSHPRQGRYSRMWLALVAYFTYQIVATVASSWVEKQTLLGNLGLWWVHALALGCAAWLLLRQDPLRGSTNQLAQAAS
jgi:lipopolysaccharide export system permease protein